MATASKTIGGDTYTITYTISQTDTTFTFTITKFTHKKTSADTASYPANFWFIHFGKAWADQTNTELDFGHNAYTIKKGETKTVFSGSKSKTINKTTEAKYAWLSMYSFGSICTIPTKTKYTISYNANSGSGAPASQSKWHGTAITLSATKPTRSGYTFKCWNTAANGSGTNYNSSASYTANAAVTLYAQWYKNHTVTFNANGGSGAPANQGKIYGTALTLSPQKPQRTGFTFIEWNTTNDGSGTSYSSGDTYTQEADLSLYAIWQAVPIIHSLFAIRCDENGSEADEGEYGYIECVWSIDNSDGDTATVTGKITPQVGGSAAPFSFSEGSSGSGGTAKALVGVSNGQYLDPDMQYTVEVTATNQPQSSVRSAIITRAFFVMDWKAGGRAIGIGRAAPEEGLEVGYETTFDDNVNVLGDLLLSFDTDAASGTDYEIYSALQALGWDEDCIVEGG